MADKTKVVKVTVAGISPLIMNRMDDETINGLITGVRPPIKKDTPFKDMAVKKIYREDGNGGGAIGIPAENLCACLVEAGRSVKNGKKQISTATTTTIYSMMAVRESFLKFTNLNGDGEGWVVDKRRGCLHDKGKTTAVGLVRPKFMEWQFEFTVEIDETEANEGLIRQLIELAGKKIGLGDFRPTCKGPFGRFKVIGWEPVEA